MKLFQLVTVSACLTLLSAACNNSGYNLPSGTQCPADYNPVPQNLQANQKTSMAPKPDGTIALKTGTYTYDHAGLYYVDNRFAPDNNYRVFLVDSKAADGSTFHGTVNCVRNSRAGLGQAEINVTTTGLGGMSIDADNKLNPDSTSIKSYSFTFLPQGQLTMTFNSVLNQKPTDPNDPTTASPDPNSFAYVHPENNNIVDVRSTGEAKDQSGNVIGNWYLSITFVRSDIK